MHALVLGGVVGVHGVCHVDAEDERAAQRGGVQVLVARARVQSGRDAAHLVRITVRVGLRVSGQG